MPRGPKYTYNPTFPIHTETSLNFVWISAAEAIQPSRTHIQKSFSHTKSSGNQTTNSRLKFLPGIPVLKLAFSLHPFLLYLCGHVFVSKKAILQIYPNIRSSQHQIQGLLCWTIFPLSLSDLVHFLLCEAILTLFWRRTPNRLILEHALTKKLVRPVYIQTKTNIKIQGQFQNTKLKGELEGLRCGTNKRFACSLDWFGG